jgi:RNA polymerase sigma-70 factor (ECF subfamily)
MPSPETDQPAFGGARDFRTTHWSVVLLAGAQTSPRSEEALERLCRTYWYPLYAYVRRRGYDAHTAQDLTQGFFERVIERNYFGDADARRGRFRTFLLASLNHFLANEWDKSQRQKRGGGRAFLSLDDQEAEERYRLEPADTTTPEYAYDRRWAETVLDVVFGKLRREIDGEGKTGRFDTLKGFLTAGGEQTSYADAAARLGVSETGVRSAVSRLRQRFRELIRAEIADTVNAPSEVDEEIRHLFAALAG